MAQETERKFLVTSAEFKKSAYSQARIVQGYLTTMPERTVRIRIEGKIGYITIKGIGNKSGISHYEWEKKIPVAEAEELLKICEPGLIEKIRFKIRAGKRYFEVDEFHGDNEGLIIAEIELKTEDEYFKKPAWLGKEITGNVKYYNSMLTRNPFTKWRR